MSMSKGTIKPIKFLLIIDNKNHFVFTIFNSKHCVDYRCKKCISLYSLEVQILEATAQNTNDSLVIFHFIYLNQVYQTFNTGIG